MNLSKFYTRKTIGFIIVAILVLIYFYFFGNKSEVFELVDICQNRITNECKIDQLPYNNLDIPLDERVDDLLKRMTLQEKIGQMMLIEKNSIEKDEDIALYGIGGLMSGMGTKPEPNTPEAWLRMVNGYRQNSETTRLGIPVIYGVDGIHGHSNIGQATIFPHFIALGATKDKDLVRRIALATTEELAATGIYWNFSPNLDVASDPRWGRYYETFGSDPNLTSELGQAYIEGINYFSLSKYRPIGTAKHFIGAGAMAWGRSSNKDFMIDQGEALLSIDELRARHLPPFKTGIDKGAGSVMVGLNSWKYKKLSENKFLVTDILKKELGFDGFVVSDWYGVYEIDRSEYKSSVKAINAGIDMVMLPFDYKNFRKNVYLALQKGDISQNRIDDAVRRILKAKFKIGLFDNPEPSKNNLGIIGSEEHRKIAREAVRKSLVLLKNERNVLPLSRQARRIYVAGPAANNLGQQMGGWSVEWQGIDGNWTAGTNILKGMQEKISSDSMLLYEEKGNFNTKDGLADIGIVVVGEKPYAEGWGDNENLKLSQEDLGIIDRVKNVSKRILVIIISGRPLDIKNEIDKWDAVVAAWLPGSEGGGVADVIFGDYPFAGTLPIEWDL